MEWIIQYWFVILAVIAILVVIGVSIASFMGWPTSTKFSKIKEWLLWAVIVAEMELGSGTGELKLRYVYDMFIEKFPLAAMLVSFETFKKWVDAALAEMRKLLAEKPAVAAVVIGTAGEIPVAVVD